MKLLLLILALFLVLSVSFQEERVLLGLAWEPPNEQKVAKAHRKHGILFSVSLPTGENFFYRGGEKCKLFNEKENVR